MNLFTRMKLKALGILLFGVCLLGSASKADAGFVIQVFDDGVDQTAGGFILPPGQTSYSLAGSTAHFSIVINTSFTVISPAVTVLDSNLQVSLAGGGGTHVLLVKLAFVGYLDPATNPLFVSSSASSNFQNSSATTDKTNFQSWAKSPSAAATLAALENGLTAGAQGANSTGGFSTGTINNGNPLTVVLPNGAGNYSLAQDLSVTLGNGIGNSGQVQGSTVVAATPVPASMLLALSGVPVLAIGAWMRRRQLSLATVS
jgi:hypothetical protein